MIKLLRYIDQINKILLWILGIFSAIMTAVLSVQVISRTFLGHSIAWSEELARFLMIYIVFIGAALALRKQQLIAIELIAEKVSLNTRRIMKTISNMIGIVFFCTMFVQGIVVVLRVHTQVSAAIQIPMSYVYAALPIGAVLLTMNAIAVIIELNIVTNTDNKRSVEQ